MSNPDRTRLVRESYRAYETADRELIERLLAEDLVFSAPPDVGIDRAAYFERCWPAHEHHRAFRYVRVLGEGDTVVVTYEAERTDGSRFRNTEVFTFAGDHVTSVEVYFGWNL